MLPAFCASTVRGEKIYLEVIEDTVSKIAYIDEKTLKVTEKHI